MNHVTKAVQATRSATRTAVDCSHAVVSLTHEAVGAKRNRRQHRKAVARLVAMNFVIAGNR